MYLNFVKRQFYMSSRIILHVGDATKLSCCEKCFTDFPGIVRQHLLNTGVLTGFFLTYNVHLTVDHAPSRLKLVS
jgi:hypothetical protein